jgi:hypothetical protein
MLDPIAGILDNHAGLTGVFDQREYGLSRSENPWLQRPVTVER